LVYLVTGSVRRLDELVSPHHEAYRPLYRWLVDEAPTGSLSIPWRDLVELVAEDDASATIRAV
jgi:hypothetical protein